MSSLMIASIIFALLVVLVGYAFISQTLEKRRQRRQRLLTALKHRQRNFKFMLSNFPPGFLTKDLSLIAYRALLDACEHLSHLEPKEPSHMEDFTHYSSEMEALKHQANPKRGRVERPEQVGEIKQQLHDLYRFIVQQAERGNIGHTQAQTYTDQIKRLAVQASVDAYTVSARQAQAAGKPRLAVHFYTLARKQLTKDGGNQIYAKQIAQLSKVINKLQQQLALETDIPGQKAGLAPEEQKEWEQFDQEEEGWKKKQIYD